jgi:hypothetical protein
MNGHVRVKLVQPREVYSPLSLLRFEYQICEIDVADIAAVEASVLWYTEGKGDSDMGVHFFERRTADAQLPQLAGPAEIAAPLPNSPLSYEGRIIKIRWCVRVRAFLRARRAARRTPLAAEIPFRLLAARAARPAPQASVNGT